MTDREKAIKGLGEVSEFFRECRENVSFASEEENHLLEFQNIAQEALSLLKAQEPVKPIMRREMDDICSCIDNIAYCGKCGALIGRLRQNYCSNCGQEVKWDD